MKLLTAWSKNMIEALSHTGGKLLAPPSATETDVEKVFMAFLKDVVDEIRRISRRLNMALDAGCAEAIRSAGVDVFYNLHQLAPQLDFKAIAARVSSGLKKNLPPKVVEAAEVLVALRPGTPKG